MSLNQNVAHVVDEYRYGIRHNLAQFSHQLVQVFFVEPSHRPAGSLRKGLASDLPLLREWAPDYARESGTKLDMQMYFERMIERELLFLWDDNGARCVTTTSKLTPNGAEISSLYTPPRFRNNGYATAAIAAASQRILDSGRTFCMIAADERAAKTNRIYRSVGYEPIGEIVVVHL
jgi:GNAT superfamily N-acetyltransferase